jgi:hypothetical protein
MKHLKHINEYKRTVGFRYSDPFLDYKIGLSINNVRFVDKSKIEEFLKSIQVKFKDIIIFNDGISIDISVYNKNEVESIVNDLAEFIVETFNVNITEVFSKKLV